MKFRLLRTVAAAGAVALVLAQPSMLLTGAPTTAHAFTYATMTPLQRRLLSGFASLELGPARDEANTVRPNNPYFPTDSSACASIFGNNVKVNQNCQNLTDSDLQGRGQANNETSIAQDPLHPAHIIASDNDYRRGDGGCYSSYSLDGGRSWSDSTIPTSFTRGTAFGAAREYWQAGGDTSVGWDTKGNAYITCQLFNRGSAVSPNTDQSSAVYVFRSTLNNGASWDFPGHPVIEFADQPGTSGVLEDKPYMTVDNHAGSPFQDRVYVTYTEFAADGTAKIYESYSNDYGQTFSPRVLVSGPSSLCPVSVGTSGACDANQDSQPFTGSDGALYVLFSNFNNSVSGLDNHNQILIAKSTDGGATFGAPVKVANYYDLPDCATYQGGADNGRACVPEKGATANSIFRASNYASGAVDPLSPKVLVVAFGSYINMHSKESNGCSPNGLSSTTFNNLYNGVKTAGACNNDILESISVDGGKTFSGTFVDPRNLTSVTPAPAQATTDQFWQWLAFTTDGRLAVSYYDRQYGSDETTGFSDVSVSGAISTTLTAFGVQRATSSSMPPPTQFSGTFFGDYTGMTAVSLVYPAWMDTRTPELFLCPNSGVPGKPPSICAMAGGNAAIANDQDIYTMAMQVPAPAR